MPRYIDPPPTVFDQAIVTWLGQAYQALALLEDLVTTTIATTRTLLAEESGLVLLANTGTINVTLPDPVVVGPGWGVLFVKTTADAFAVTLVGTINGAVNNNQIDAQYDRIGLRSTGSSYVITEREIS